MSARLPPLTVTRILARCSYCEGCRLWKFGTSTSGMPSIWVPGQRVKLARRVMWELANRTPIPEGLVIAVSCHQMLCLRPDHLVPMTRAEASAHASAGGSFDTVRHRVARASNSRKSAKLDMKQARKIRAALAAGDRVPDVADRHAISQGHLYAVRRGERWAEAPMRGSSVFHL